MQTISAESILREAVPFGSVAIWPLGQMGCVIKLGQDILLLDAYLSNSAKRLVPPVLPLNEIKFAGLVAGSHDHSDHIDRPVWKQLAAENPDLEFLAPEAVKGSLVGEIVPPERLHTLSDGQWMQYGNTKISAIPSAHEFLDRNLQTGLYPYLGYCLEGNGVKIYHSGDSCRYEGMLGKIREFAPDLIFLPINGRDATRLKRNCIGNMTWQEAADLAGEIGPKLTIPGHFDMFAGNLGPVDDFVEYFQFKYPLLTCQKPIPGQIIHFHNSGE